MVQIAIDGAEYGVRRSVRNGGAYRLKLGVRAARIKAARYCFSYMLRAGSVSWWCARGMQVELRQLWR